MSNPLDRIVERMLVLRCQAGDEAAFAELVQRYNPRLLAPRDAATYDAGLLEIASELAQLRQMLAVKEG